MLRLGINLPTFDPLRVGGPPRFVEAARLAEEIGFDAVWVGDHLHMPAPVYDSTVALAAAAAVTERVKLGFGVMLLGLRQPAWVAKQLTTIDALAPGRLLLGVGVGGEFPQEFEAVGLSVKRRGRLLDEALAALPDWLAGTIDAGTRADDQHAAAADRRRPQRRRARARGARRRRLALDLDEPRPDA